LPLTQGYDLTFNGGVDVYVFKLNPEGDELLFTTYFGGSNTDWRTTGMDLADNNDIVFTCFTCSVDLPTPNGYCPNNQGGWDAFVARLSADGMDLLAGTYLGTPSSYDTNRDVIVDSAGDVIVLADSDSSGFPLVNSYSEYNGRIDGYIAKFSPYLDDIKWSTYFGGTGSEMFFSLSLDENDNIYFAGDSNSTDIELVNPICVFPTLLDVSGASFIGMFSSDGQELLWSTFILPRHHTYWTGGTWITKILYSNGDIYVKSHTDNGSEIDNTPNSFIDYGKDSSGLPNLYNNFYKISRQENEITWGSYFFRRNPFSGGEAVYHVVHINDMVLTSEGNVVILGEEDGAEYNSFNYIPTDTDSYMPRNPSYDYWEHSGYVAVLDNPTERAMIKPPELLVPCDQAVDQDLQVTLSWRKTEPLLPETGYLVRIRQDDNSNTLRQYKLPAGVYELTVNNLKTGNTYAWNVKALGDGVYPHESYWANGCIDFRFQTRFERVPCYRFYNGEIGDHLFTPNEKERDYLLQNEPNYQYEGIGFYVYRTDEWPETELVRRFRHDHTQHHVLIVFPQEPPGGTPQYWSIENWAKFYAFTFQAPHTVPVYRLHDTVRGDYLYTISDAERDYVLNTFPDYEDQGIVFYVYPTQE